jgi:hypothetical protein
MNERIKELAAQASDDGDHIHYYNLAFAEKFAELLLEEFIEALEESNGTHSETSEYGLSILVSDIKRHFGVEE